MGICFACSGSQFKSCKHRTSQFRVVVNVSSELLFLDNFSGIKKLVSNGTLSRHMNLTSVRLKCFKIN